MTCINRDTIIYHTETQADYDALMVELESDGVTWRSGVLPTKENNWKVRPKNMCVAVSHQVAEYGSVDTYLKIYSDIPVTKYKAKADDKMKFTKENVYKMVERYRSDFDYLIDDLKSDIFNLDATPEKVVVPKFVAEWIEWNKETGADLQTTLKCYRHYCDNAKAYSDDVYGKKAVQWYVDNPYKFIQAYKDGYTIEPEQLYYIPLPDLETTDGLQQVLSKRENGMNYFASRPNENLKQRFTKEELAQVPEVYKPYVKPVEEESE